jgi:hypothetical protein
VVLHPVGPLPASTYWRRRAVVLLPVLALLLIVKSCAGGGSSHKPGATATPSPTRTSTPSPSPSPTPSPTPVSASGVCADSDLSLVTTTDASSYEVGGSPVFTLAVTNRSKTACTRDLGATVVSFLVVSGTARTWSSDDCSPAKGSKPTRLAPGKTTQVVQLTWSGKRSQQGCPSPREQAGAGTYQVSGRVGTLISARVVFHFR